MSDANTQNEIISAVVSTMICPSSGVRGQGNHLSTYAGIAGATKYDGTKYPALMELMGIGNPKKNR